MQVLVIGAGGKTGRLVVKRALAAGFGVSALVHSSGNDEEHPLPDGVRVVQGDVLDPASVRTAMQGCEAVVDAIGGKTPWKKTDLESSAARVVIEAMRATGAKRLVVVSVLGAGDSGDQAPFWYEHILAPTFLHGAIPDKNAMEAEVQASGLEWVLVRPPVLTDGEATGKVHILKDGETAHKITRADLAQFIVDRLTGVELLGRAVVIANS